MLETERLLIRKYTLADLPTLIVQRTAPNVARFIGGISIQTPEFIEKRLKNYIENYETLGYGACAVIWKETGENIGWSGLQPLEDSGETEVGYGFIEKFWRRGIGYECASAWLRWGFENAGLERIVAVADEENEGSWRIMQKCGMKNEGLRFHYGAELVYYSISKDEWIKNR